MKDSVSESFLQALPGENLLRGVSLSEYTYIRCGGPAWALLDVSSVEEAAQALKAAGAGDIPLLILGNGSNTLIEDKGFPGLVLHFGKNFSKVWSEGSSIFAQAGAPLKAISRLAAERGLSGLEFAEGIPASLGGAALMNAGAYGGEMSRVVRRLLCLDRAGERLTLEKEELDYGYRHSRVMDRGYIVLSAELELTPADTAGIRERMAENQAQRVLKQPLSFPSAGSFFKRPEGHFAGALIEQAGMKGRTVGKAQVSELHAGFLINLGGATAEDFFQLAALVQQQVEEMFGVRLEPEVRMIRSRA